MQTFVGLFMECLVRNEIMTICVPQNSFLEAAGTTICPEESSGTLRRNLNSMETSHKYTQLIAIAAIVAELHSCKNAINSFK
jgi:hypothetical protein